MFGQESLLTMFSKPDLEDGYNDVSIMSDMITDVYLDFVEQTRQTESADYCKTLTGMWVIPSQIHKILDVVFSSMPVPQQYLQISWKSHSC